MEMKFDLCTIDWIAISAIATMLMVLITVIVLIVNWKQQKFIQKQNIKVQLFEKRYSIYATVCNISKFISHQNIVFKILTRTLQQDELWEKLNNYSEDLTHKKNLTEAIFGNSKVCEKMSIICKKYDAFLLNFNQNVFYLYFLTDFDITKDERILQIKANNKISRQEKLEKLNEINPEMKRIIQEWNNLVDNFNNYF